MGLYRQSLNEQNMLEQSITSFNTEITQRNDPNYDFVSGTRLDRKPEVIKIRYILF